MLKDRCGTAPLRDLDYRREGSRMLVIDSVLVIAVVDHFGFFVYGFHMDRIIRLCESVMVITFPFKWPGWAQAPMQI